MRKAIIVDNVILQILLHDPDEEPQMKDLAYAVSPGGHTLLAIKITKVSHFILNAHSLFFVLKWTRLFNNL